MAITDSQKKDDSTLTVEVGVKQFIRIISEQNISDPDANIWRVDEIDEYIRQYQEHGFKLLTAQFVRYIPAENTHPSGFQMFYVMTK